MDVVLYILCAIIVILSIVGFYHHRRGHDKIIHVIDDNCTGCRTCLKKCRRNVLELTSKKARSRIVVKNPLNCTGCGDCVTACKFEALKLMKK
jgi:NAD-dependent dihydropyrimidine dehydrogenase PreA subunit